MSISTPQGHSPSIHDLDSEVSTEPDVHPVCADLREDIQRMLEQMQQVANNPVADNTDILIRIHEVQDELRDLSDFVRNREIPTVRAQSRLLFFHC